jgi:hypothetical protein
MDMNSVMIIFQPLLTELNERYNIPLQHITLWGFSGGAKAAMYAADLIPDIPNVIYGGAYYPISSSKKQLGFAGTQDMNYSDLINYNISQQNNPAHLQIEFDGKHTWPDSITAAEAFTWLHLQQEENNSSYIQAFYQDLKIKYEKLLEQEKYYRANMILDEAEFMLKDKTDISYFQKAEAELRLNAGLQQEIESRKLTQAKEEELKNYYAQQFFTQPAEWWQTEIKKLSASNDPMHQRIVAFFSLAAYSLSNNALKTNDLKAAGQILTIYQLSDPTNPEQAFLRAVLYARQHDNIKSKAALEEAKSLGFSDWKRVSNDPDLKKIN